MPRAVKWLLAILAILAVLVVVFFIIFNWNMLRGPLEDRISEQAGRAFEIEGDLEGEYSLTPWITMERVRLANPEWASEPQMVEIEDLGLRVDLLALVRGEVVIPALRVQGARINLEVDEDGRQNWVTDEAADGPTDLPVIERLRVEESELILRDRSRQIEMGAGIEVWAGITPEEGILPVRLEGSGSIADEPFELLVRSGPLQDLMRQEETPYPLKIDLDAGDTTASFAGRLTDLEGRIGIDAAVGIAGPNLIRLAPLLQLPLPFTPAYELSGRLLRDDSRWVLEDFSGTAGDSDLSGTAAVDLGRERRFIEADLSSENLDAADLAAMLGMDPEVFGGGAEDAEEAQDEAPEEKDPDRVLPDAPLQLERVRGTDASVTFRGERVSAPGLPVKTVALDLELEDGVLRLAPLSFGLAGGELNFFTSIYSNEDPVQTDFDIRLSNASLNELFAGMDLEGDAEGAFQGRVRFTTFGDTIRSAMDTAEGDAAVVMGDAFVTGSTLGLLDVSFLEALAVVITDGEPEDMNIRCFVAAFDIQDGVMTTNPVLLDTEDSLIVGEGKIDFGEETVDLRIAAEPKEFTLGGSRVPIEISGPFVSPDISVDPSETAIRGGLAAALGTLLTPLAAVIPMLDIDIAEDSPCHDLIEQAEGEVEEE